ncbi:acetyl-CoA acetyltransferase [Halioglobus japonicus]|uniref:Acetyl-CoA C-acyltransferase n=1 Tax=Halioglobus japonicus TaxID=930805 RepID=A0AAP8MHX8_9GAMM|nr:acetyl-CoA C-acyltransferase [Halioglobus japonicus]AQA20291.1 acetyl-CoA acetyltransferase [Halioglobus japonicus]PLW88180.1 acetyl-CoA C-acyltransferase [Halioglobus japonicus]GHD20081.1 acyl-CoA thiolase [Halioglobus japonicus]
MSEETVVIVDGARTPMGGLQGSLSSVPAPELASTAVRAALAKSGIGGDAVDEVFMGCVLPAGLKQCPARQTAIGADIPVSAGAVTVNKACGSGMQAAIFGYDSIVAGTNSVVVAGGMESMSNAPHMLPTGSRGGLRTGHTQLFDHMFLDGLEDAYTGRAMGSFAQETADERGITREQMDAFAVESLSRAKAAIDDGSLKAEIAPVTVKSRRGETVVEDDEQPHKAAVDKIPNLRPAFAKDGTITAANASSISDGASALVMMSAAVAGERGLQPLARMVAHARHSQAPGEFTIAPIGAIQKLLQKTGWSVEDVDLFEINEAFAMVTMLAMEDLGLDHAKVNIHGGACAQGHPIGSTGSRILVSLMYALKKLGKKRGVAALCIGGGEATAVAIELIEE